MTEPFVTMLVRLPATVLAGGAPFLVITAEAVVIVMPAGGGAARSGQGMRREHILLCLAEADVQETVRTVIETDETLTRLAPEMVSDADIHAACRMVAENGNLAEELGAARFRAAFVAIRLAERRLGCSASVISAARPFSEPGHCAGLIRYGRTFMPIPDHVKANFQTLLRAAAAGDLALVAGTDVRTGEPRFILCAVGRAEGGDAVLTPFGHLAAGNPFDDYEPPFDPGG